MDLSREMLHGLDLDENQIKEALKAQQAFDKQQEAKNKGSTNLFSSIAKAVIGVIPTPYGGSKKLETKFTKELPHRPPAVQDNDLYAVGKSYAIFRQQTHDYIRTQFADVVAQNFDILLPKSEDLIRNGQAMFIDQVIEGAEYYEGEVEDTSCVIEVHRDSVRNVEFEKTRMVHKVFFRLPHSRQPGVGLIFKRCALSIQPKSSFALDAYEFDTITVCGKVLKSTPRMLTVLFNCSKESFRRLQAMGAILVLWHSDADRNRLINLYQVYYERMCRENALFKSILQISNRGPLTSRFNERANLFLALTRDDSSWQPFQALNRSQKNAVKGSLMAESFFLIHSPPGTGKTTTLTVILEALAKTNLKVLVCSHTEEGVDKLLASFLRSQTFHTMGLDNPGSILRVGDIADIADDFKKYSMHHIVKSRSVFGATLEVKVIQELVVKSCMIVFSTLSGVFKNIVRSNYIQPKDMFEYLLIDDAEQAFFAYDMMAIALSKRVILAGDHKLMPPNIRSPEHRVELKRSLFERLFDLRTSVPQNIPVYEMLDTQFVMNHLINKTSALEYYDGWPKTYPGNANIVLKDLASGDGHYIPNHEPIIWIDQPGFETQVQGGEFVNQHEQGLVLELVKDLTSRIGIKLEDIGVVTPYNHQKHALHQTLAADPFFEGVEFGENSLLISTIGGFQGRRREVVIVASTRANNSQDLGHILGDHQWFNTAVTRGNRCLIFIGCSNTAGVHLRSPVRPLFNYFKENGMWMRWNPSDGKISIKEINRWRTLTTPKPVLPPPRKVQNRVPQAVPPRVAVSSVQNTPIPFSFFDATPFNPPIPEFAASENPKNYWSMDSNPFNPPKHTQVESEKPRPEVENKLPENRTQPVALPKPTQVEPGKPRPEVQNKMPEIKPQPAITAKPELIQQPPPPISSDDKSLLDYLVSTDDANDRHQIFIQNPNLEYYYNQIIENQKNESNQSAQKSESSYVKIFDRQIAEQKNFKSDESSIHQVAAQNRPPLASNTVRPSIIGSVNQGNQKFQTKPQEKPRSSGIEHLVKVFGLDESIVEGEDEIKPDTPPKSEVRPALVHEMKEDKVTPAEEQKQSASFGGFIFNKFEPSGIELNSELKKRLKNLSIDKPYTEESKGNASEEVSEFIGGKKLEDINSDKKNKIAQNKPPQAGNALQPKKSPQEAPPNPTSKEVLNSTMANRNPLLDKFIKPAHPEDKKVEVGKDKTQPTDDSGSKKLSSNSPLLQEMGTETHSNSHNSKTEKTLPKEQNPFGERQKPQVEETATPQKDKVSLLSLLIQQQEKKTPTLETLTLKLQEKQNEISGLNLKPKMEEVQVNITHPLPQSKPVENTAEVSVLTPKKQEVSILNKFLAQEHEKSSSPHDNRNTPKEKNDNLEPYKNDKVEELADPETISNEFSEEVVNDESRILEEHEYQEIKPNNESSRQSVSILDKFIIANAGKVHIPLKESTYIPEKDLTPLLMKQQSPLKVNSEPNKTPKDHQPPQSDQLAIKTPPKNLASKQPSKNTIQSDQNPANAKLPNPFDTNNSNSSIATNTIQKKLKPTITSVNDPSDKTPPVKVGFPSKSGDKNQTTVPPPVDKPTKTLLSSFMPKGFPHANLVTNNQAEKKDGNVADRGKQVPNPFESSDED